MAAGLVIAMNQEYQLTKTLQFPQFIVYGCCAYLGTQVAHQRNEDTPIRKQELHTRDRVKYCWLLLNVLAYRKEMKNHSHSWKDMRELFMDIVDQ